MESNTDTTVPVPTFTGKGGGKGGKIMSAKRHRLDLNDKPAFKRINRSSIRKMHRRAGVKRISNECYEFFRAMMRTRMLQILAPAALYAEHGRRTTIMAPDIRHASKHIGNTLLA